MTSTADQAPTHVVTCFLRRGDRYLLLMRSQAVRTHRGLWAGVSGYIEQGETPLETALKELGEEVGAPPDHVRLVREAAPLVFDDPPSGTRWAVHPFLFDDLGVEVRLDWEHGGSRWVTRGELASMETVPGLAETLDAALGVAAATPRDEKARGGLP